LSFGDHINSGDLKKLKNNYGKCDNCHIAMWGRPTKEEKFPDGIVICDVCQMIEHIEDIKKNINKENKNA
tara:strand:+ start:292 stop:501 length:210 start_codon:yes stop_codon:yes gene_type:complete